MDTVPGLCCVWACVCVFGGLLLSSLRSEAMGRS
jgi:hypothetical protein